MPRAALAPWVLSFLLCAACASGSRASPSATVSAYRSALAEQDYAKAYELLSREVRAELSYGEFEKLCKERPDEVKALLRSLERPSEAPVVTTSVRTESGDELLLVFEDGAWRIDESALDPYAQTDPKRTLLSFSRAVRQKRYDVLLRFVPRAYLEGLSEDLLRQAFEGDDREEVMRLVAGVERYLGQKPVEIVSDRASFEYGTDHIAELVLEDGVWKIEEFR